MKELESNVYDLIHEEVSKHLDDLYKSIENTTKIAAKYDYDIEDSNDEIFHEVHGVVMKEVIKEIGLYIGLDYEK